MRCPKHYEKHCESDACFLIRKASRQHSDLGRFARLLHPMKLGRCDFNQVVPQWVPGGFPEHFANGRFVYRFFGQTKRPLANCPAVHSYTVLCVPTVPREHFANGRLGKPVWAAPRVNVLQTASVSRATNSLANPSSQVILGDSQPLLTAKPQETQSPLVVLRALR